MKVLALLVGIFALAQAEYDWSSITPLHLHTRGILGFPKIAQRIVGGEEAKPHSLPYQVAMFVHMDNGVAFCGGSLISENYVLTAAHCVEPAHLIEVVLGAHNVRENESTQVRLNCTEFNVHEKWSMLTLQNDIALVKLPEPVQLNENIKLSKLPSRSDVGNLFEDEETIASGWGKDADSATGISEVLRRVEVPVLEQLTCALVYFGVITDSHICTVSVGGKSTCSGDSGGPLVLKENNKQVGIVSFGVSLGCELGFPAAFTRTTSYLDWIEERTDVTIEN